MDYIWIGLILFAVVTSTIAVKDEEEICTTFLNDNNIKDRLSSNSETSTACPCDETTISSDQSFKKADHCYQEWFYDAHGSKQMCCYSNSGQLLTGAPFGGYLSLKSYLENITKAHEACCHVRSGNRCALFYDINPSDDCSRYNDPYIVKSWGDPTITTLDKFQYDFNGHGEYWFLSTRKVEIQARTEYVTMGNIDATMFTAFVIMLYSPGVLPIELHFNRSSMSISVYSFGVEIGNSLRTPLSPINHPKLSGCILAGDNMIILMRCGLDTFSKSIQFSAAEFMSIEINVDKRKMHNMTFKGLAEPRINDTLVMRNGSNVKENATQAQMFDFGESWKLVSNESRFNYSITGKSFEFYNSNHTRPRFYGELVGNLTALFQGKSKEDIDKYNRTCRNYWNNEPNIQCLLTIARTGLYDNGVVAMKEANTTRLKWEMKHNLAPSFTDSIPDKVKVILRGFNDSYIIDLNDYVYDTDISDDLRFTVESNLPEFELGNGEFQWTLKESLRNLTSIDIIFHVFDKFNATTSHTLKVDFCGCEHGISECDFSEENNETGTIAKCKCEKYYSGEFCENTIDPCLVTTCYLDHCNSSVAVGEDPCEPCPKGYQGDGRDCTDVDECDVSYYGTDKCEQICTNSNGSFTCDCRSTYTLNDDKHSCSDINECVEGLLNCSDHELCVNIIGGAQCVCATGYIRKGTGGSCDSVTGTSQYPGSMSFSIISTTVLTSSSDVNTLYNMEVINSELDKWFQGTKEYVAVEVYELQVTSRRRRATGSSKAHIDVNFIVYASNGTGKEIGAAIEEGYRNYKSAYTDLRTSIMVSGTEVSLHPDVVSMRSPSAFGLCDIPDRTDCNTTTTMCKNTDGGFDCSCLSGYVKDISSINKCIDMDECAIFKENHTLEQQCVHGNCLNKEGTWECICPSDMELQTVGEVSFSVYRCQGNYSYVGEIGISIEEAANDTDMVDAIVQYLMMSYRNQNFEDKLFPAPIRDLFVGPSVLDLHSEFTNKYVITFILRIGEVVAVQRVADVLNKALNASSVITGRSLNGNITYSHIFTDEDNMLCNMNSNSDCDLSTTTCQQANGTISCQCLVGYERIDDNSCKAKDCGPILHPENGWVNLTNSRTTFNSSATFGCNKGYDLDGDRGALCTASGHWSSNATCLIKDCGILSIPDHGDVAFGNNVTTYKSIATITCDEGYFLSDGVETSVCGPDGNWTSTPNCVIYDCGELTIEEHGSVFIATNVTTFNSTATFTCEPGYRLTTDNYSICNSSGQWTNQPQCKIKDCRGLQAPLHGHVQLDNGTTTYRSMAIYECVLGYYLSDNDTSYCQPSGHWSNIPSCIIKDCGILSIPDHGDVAFGNNLTTYQSIASISCDDGYYLDDGNETSVCGPDGKWTSTPNCVIYDCGKLAIEEHGSVCIATNVTTFNSTATFTCEPGYRLTTDNYSICNSSGQWTNQPQCEKKDCGGLQAPLHGYVQLANGTTTYRSMAKYECVLGYFLSDNDTTYCQPSGYWSNIPSCIIKECGEWSNNSTIEINNVTVEYDNSNKTYGTIATAECLPGYHVNASSKTQDFALCRGDATWSKLLPMCVETVCSCVRPDNESHVEVEYYPSTSPYHVHTVALSTCPDDYNVKGFQNLTCLPSGQWDNDPPTCVLVSKDVRDCDKDAKDADYIWETTKPGTTVTKQCPPGFEGAVTRHCSIKGEWNKTINSCVHKDILNIKNMVDSLKENISDPITVTNILDKLENITKPAHANATANVPMTLQGFEEVASSLSTLVDKSEHLVVTEKQTKPFLDTTSNLLDFISSISGGTEPTSEESDDNLPETNAAVKLLDTVSAYTDVVVKSLSPTNNMTTIEAKNLIMHVRKISGIEQSVKFPSKDDNVSTTSSVSIPNESLKGLTNVKFVFYRNLSGILSSTSVQNGEGYTHINSEVMSVDIDGWEKNRDHFKLSMSFNQFNGSGEADGVPHCNFWDEINVGWNRSGCRLVEGASNSTKSVCECDHLTNFAILMSPWIESSDAKALDIISITGCSVSLLGLLVTVIMHLLLWRYLKSDRVVILMNLCLALILSYGIFLGGVDQTENKDACTVVAVLLQYIYLVVFFLMLAEGIELAVTVLYVFSTTSRLKWILPLSWFLPAVITGISMASTTLNGYGNELFCWLSIEGGLIWAFVAPAFTIIVVNIVLLVLVMRQMFRAQTLAQKSQTQRAKAGVRCLCILLPLMGITWVIGIFYVNEETVWIQYIFAVCNSLQGLIIFIFHCALNTQIRRAIKSRHKKYTDSLQVSKSTTFSIPRVRRHEVYDNMTYNMMASEIKPDYEHAWQTDS